jgi:tetratricopeptide (TPR) repeat protein
LVSSIPRPAMRRLKSLVIEIHRRSLWQVLAVYLAASWIVLQAAEHVVDRYLLPEWAYGAAVILLLVGLPIVLATALVREDPLPGSGGRGQHQDGTPDETGETGSVGPASVRDRRSPVTGVQASPIGLLLTWPRALAGGVLAFTALIMVTGFMVVRGMPRIAEARGSAGDAFAERGWVVVAEFDAADPEDAPLALAAREALVVDLQQSAFVNVYARQQIRGILERMGLPDTTHLTLPVALEVAERAGAGAVLAARVSRLGNQYVLSGRAIGPSTGEELFAVRTATGAARLLEGVETLSREMRRRLGEERETLRQSRPLPEVTTSSVEALRIYTEAEDASSRHDSDRAAALVAEAIRLDPDFAMAHRLAGVIASNQALLSEAGRHLERAAELGDRLTDRERMHVEAHYQLQVALEPRRAAEAYERLLARYPDDFRATNNLAVVVGDWLADPESALPWFGRAVELDPHQENVFFNYLGIQYLTGRRAAGDSLVRIAEERGYHESLAHWRPGRRFADGDYADASGACEALLADPAVGLRAAFNREMCATMKLAQGRLRTALPALQDVDRSYGERDMFRRQTEVGVAMAMARALAGDAEAGAAILADLLDRFQGREIPEPDRSIVETDLRVAAALLERPDLLARIDAAYAYPEPGHYLSRTGAALARAARALFGNDGAAALAALRAEPTIPSGWTITDLLLTGLAFAASETPDSAAVYLGRATSPEVAGDGGTRTRTYFPLALLHLARAEEARGNRDGAVRAYRRLLDLWADADPGLQPQVESVRAALARLAAAG